MIRSQSGAWPRSFLSGDVRILQDTPSPPAGIGQTVRSPGATTIIPAVMGGPDISQNWTIISVSIQAYAVLCGGFTTAPLNCCGKFGKAVAALIPQGTSSTAISNSEPWTYPMLPLPSDSTLTEDLWNPANDDLPPLSWFDTLQTESNQIPLDTTLPVSAVISPPVPIRIEYGVQPALGIWLTPSLFTNLAASESLPFGLTFINGSYTVNYDDGLAL